MGTKKTTKSAGYFNVIGKQIIVNGSSHSMNIPSHKSDSEVLLKHLKNVNRNKSK